MPNTSRTIDGAAARAIREAMGLSVSAVATQTGITRGTLSNIETGKRGARLTVILALARALGVHPDRISTAEQCSARSA